MPGEVLIGGIVVNRRGYNAGRERGSEGVGTEVYEEGAILSGG
jgi:hypothetical protein